MANKEQELVLAVSFDEGDWTVTEELDLLWECELSELVFVDSFGQKVGVDGQTAGCVRWCVAFGVFQEQLEFFFACAHVISSAIFRCCAQIS